jgi:hypothetical protein
MDTPTVTLADLSDPAPEPGPWDWNEDGVIHLPGLIPGSLIEAYEEAWMESNGFRGLTDAPQEQQRALPEVGWSSGPMETAQDTHGLLWVMDAARPGGWPDTCPYMRHPELLELCMYGPLAEALTAAIGEPAGLHLNLSGWQSTERRWHQDTYLNPLHVGDAYAAVWIALGDVHPDAGVFQFVPGSHRWHTLTRDRISRVVDISDPLWPTHTEAVLTPLVEAELEARGVPVVDYVPRKGDVLLWHPRLYHQGSPPKVEHAYRPALIAHYSGIRHRPDMPAPVQHEAGGWFFPIVTGNPVR